eukprot:m.51651 g.51651  ORF g.51651 m.51651 type:complete len:213 (-) comp16459_c1_seq1:5338-5976(-)
MVDEGGVIGTDAPKPAGPSEAQRDHKSTKGDRKKRSKDERTKRKKDKKSKKSKFEKKAKRHRKREEDKSESECVSAIAKQRVRLPPSPQAHVGAVVAAAVVLPSDPDAVRATSLGTVRRRPTADEIAAARAGVVRRRVAPMAVQSQDDYLRQQNVVRKVYDPDTGRQRLVRGDGEIIEEIVSRDRQREINAAATAEDGATFQRTVGLLKDPP